MNTLKQRLEEAILSIEQTTTLFYQNKISEGLDQLESTLVVISNAIDEVFAYKSQGSEIGIEEARLNEVLTEAMKALEIRDMLLVSDILTYELKELLQQIIKTVK